VRNSQSPFPVYNIEPESFSVCSGFAEFFVVVCLTWFARRGNYSYKVKIRKLRRKGESLAKKIKKSKART
jgi:hypothetical protein